MFTHAVVVQQQPQNVCEGFENLLNTTLPDDITCDVTQMDITTDCERIECSSPTESITLSTLPCNRSITVAVMDQNSTATLISSTLFSQPHPQTLNYMTPAGDSQYLNVSVQVVTSDGSDYYIIMLESSFGLDLQMTAIPLTCPSGIHVNQELKSSPLPISLQS